MSDDTVTTWEAISPFNRLDRIRVPGGWIYRTTHTNAVALCFVPLVPEDESVLLVNPLDNQTKHGP
jgi:hypothetical protein